MYRPRRRDTSAPGPSLQGLAFYGSSSLVAWIILMACSSPPVRPYYSREAGKYFTPTPEVTPTPVVPKGLAAIGTDSAGTANPGPDKLRLVAESYLGVPYRRAGQTRSGMDCSGFVRQVFSEAYGLDLPHNSRQMYRLGKRVAKGDLRLGDVVFFREAGFIDHSGIYVGNGYFIHSASSIGVSYSTLTAPYFGTRYAGASRIPDPAEKAEVPEASDGAQVRNVGTVP